MTVEAPLRILIVEDSVDDALLILRELRRDGVNFEYELVDSEPTLLDALERGAWDVVLSDQSMPGFSGSAALNILKSRGLDIPFIIVSGQLGEDAAVEAMKAGADDFFIKGKTKRLVPAIEREVNDARERRQRRWAEEQLRASEERFKKAFQSSPVAISITTFDDGVFIDVNDAYLKMVGYSRDELIGKRVDETALRLDPGKRADTVRQILAHGPIHSQESELRASDGSVRHVLVSLDRIQFGEQDCMLAMLFDVTEMKLAEAAEQEQRAYANALRDVASLLVGSLDLNTVMANILEQVAKVVPHEAALILLIDNGRARVAYTHGYSDADTHALRDYTFHLDTSLPGNLTNGPAAEISWAALPGHGWVRSTVSSQIRTRDRLVGLIALHRAAADAYTAIDAEHLRAFADHTAMALNNARLYNEVQQHADQLERRVDQRTAQLRQAKETVEAILNSTSDAIFLAYPDGTIAGSNPAFTLLFGQPAAQFRLASELVPPDQSDLLANALTQVTRGSQPEHIDIVCRRFDGETFTAEIAISPTPILWEEDFVLICSVRDISHRKALESELRAALARERELRELKASFVSMITHEFKTPLASIQSSNELLKHYHDRLDAPRRNSQHDQIQTQVGHLTRLVDDILTISKSDQVGLEFKPVVTDIEALGRGLVDEIAQVASAHRLELRTEGDCRQVVVDPQLTRQMLLNLLSNAVKYSEAGDKVTIVLANDSDAFRIEVRDEGIGIPEDDLPHLFEKFHRGSNVRGIPGTGLGLVLVKLAVDAHGGRISVSSSANAGTTFTIVLPRVEMQV